MLSKDQLAFQIRLFVLFVTIGLFVVAYQLPMPSAPKARASASGPTPGHTNAPGEGNCTACHTEFPVNSGSGSFFITGLPRNYLPGQQINLAVTLNQSDGVLWGFQLTAVKQDGASIGSYILPPGPPVELQLDNGIIDGRPRTYVSHNVNGTTSPVFGTKTWNFVWTAPSQRVGKIRFFAAGNAANSDGGTGGDYIYTATATTLSGSALSNFDADDKSDIAIYRPSNGVWVSQNSTDGGFISNQFGQAGDIMVPGDYDGDGKTDLAVFRPSAGFWYVAKSSGGFIAAPWGSAGDVPVPGDFDGDLKADFAVWRPSDRTWYIYRSSDGGYDIRSFGLAGDVPVQADYDADGKTDVAIYRPSEGVWFIWRSTDAGFTIFPFGLTGDRPVQGDYDGDGKADPALYRPSEGFWYLLRSTDGYTGGPFGIATDTPAPADYDGDGKTDVAIFRDGTWFILRSSDGNVAIANFGLSGDKPVASGYIPNLP